MNVPPCVTSTAKPDVPRTPNWLMLSTNHHLICEQFGNQVDKNGNVYYYTINGSWCAKGLDVVYPTGNTLLSTFGFSSSQEHMYEDIYALWTGALWCVAISFGVLVLSSEAPKVKAALRRIVRINPIGLCRALLRAIICGSTGSWERHSEVGPDGPQSTERCILLAGRPIEFCLLPTLVA